MESQVNRNETLLVSAGRSRKPALPCVPVDSVFIHGSGSAALALLSVIKLLSKCLFYQNQQGALLFFLCLEVYWGGEAICFRKATALVPSIRGMGMCISRFLKSRFNVSSMFILPKVE